MSFWKAVRKAAAAAFLALPAAAGEWPDAGGAHEYARLDWELIERDIKNVKDCGLEVAALFT